MRYFSLSIATLLTLFSCKSKQQQAADDTKKFIDSLEIERKVDSMTKASMANIYWDTVGVYNAPIKVLSAKLVRREYSNYKDMALVYKNVSNKRISAVRFSWYGENAFGEPADMGGLTQEGFGGGFDDSGLGAGKTGSGEWSILSKNGKKVIMAWPREVVFEDGTKWKSEFK